MLQTPRLLLRQWRQEDLPAFAAMNADPRVMEYFPGVLTRAESDALVTRISEQINRNAYGLWAVEAPDVADFIGFVGLNKPKFTAHFTPCLELAWRLAYDHWGHGYATEAARAAVEFALGQLQRDEVVAFTVPANLRSRRVMERLGMTHSPTDDFDRPNLPEGHWLRRHVLYRLARAGWKPASSP